ncbi:MAG: AbrB/MazE/SpoVT family DNA-binding domain-containing protein [Bifidobacteriaceae bacterium]|jgi:AbrB family looped-hinge helix DNA binding protein|nr:AbrB/MazE/SpoVT family DNA-binding domain-containing protein [Bifidobacteriaceae bacterium]
MALATLTSKGQVTIPAEIRRELGLTEGTKLEFFARPDNTIEVIPRKLTLRDLYGILPFPGSAVPKAKAAAQPPAEDLDQLVGQAVVDHDQTAGA